MASDHLAANDASAVEPVPEAASQRTAASRAVASDAVEGDAAEGATFEVLDLERLLASHRDIVEVVAARTWRLFTRQWSRVCSELAKDGVPAARVRYAKRLLDYPVHGFDWVLVRSRALGPGSALGVGDALAVDVMWFLTQLEGKTLRSGPWMPRDLLDQYLLGQALSRATAQDARQISRVLGNLFGRDERGLPPLTAALLAFERFRRPALGARSAHESWQTDDRLELEERTPHGRIALGATLATVAGFALVGALAGDAAAWQRLAEHAATQPATRLGLSIGVIILALTLAASRGHSGALLLTLLFGVPLEHPLSWLGGERRALARKARWLSDFLKQRPRTNNTPGAHLAYGMIAVKRTLKQLALRRERACQSIRQGEQRRRWLIRERNRAACRVYEGLIDDATAAVRDSRRQHALDAELAETSQALFARRLELQASVVGAFEGAWQAELDAGRVSLAQHARAREELQQPPREPPALLPLGLTRRPLVWLFEYGMFFGRLGMALAFVTTFQTPYLGVAILLFVLNAFVVEPVVFKLQLSMLGPWLRGPGHPLCDVERYMRELPEGQVFRLPITVPKFSSNPAWTNLNAIIQAALTRSLTTSFTLVPFALRQGRKHVSIELEDGAERDVAARASVLCDALAAELEAGRAKLPLGTRVYAAGRRVTIELTDDDETIWAMIGEDAGQAIIYLWRNLHALADTLAHLGKRFQPVFILASNTEDLDVIEFEVRELEKLQAWSDRSYGGQVGFLYLLRGGAWFSYASRLERFDEKDKTFVRAVGHFKERLSDPATPAREHLLQALIRTLEPKQLAAAFNSTLRDECFYQAFADFPFERLPRHAAPGDEVLALLRRKRAGGELSAEELTTLNRELLLTALPMRNRGAFFKKVGNDIAVQELLVAGKTRPTTYVDRRSQEHVQDPTLPNYARVWGDFARYTGLAGSSEEIRDGILKGVDLEVQHVPELGAILDDKNEFAPGEIEKGLATLLHPENRHIVIGVPRIDVTLPEQAGSAVASEFILAAQAARSAHNAADALTRTRLFSFATPAYGKWFERPRPYLAHYTRESLNAAHALSHDFQQSYLVAGAGGRLGGFTEALYGPTHFEVRAARERSAPAGGGSEPHAARLCIRGLVQRIISPFRARERVR